MSSNKQRLCVLIRKKKTLWWKKTFCWWSWCRIRAFTNKMEQTIPNLYELVANSICRVGNDKPYSASNHIQSPPVSITQQHKKLYSIWLMPANPPLSDQSFCMSSFPVLYMCSLQLSHHIPLHALCWSNPSSEILRELLHHCPHTAEPKEYFSCNRNPSWGNPSWDYVPNGWSVINIILKSSFLVPSYSPPPHIRENWDSIYVGLPQSYHQWNTELQNKPGISDCL